jgi:hypothetical protein
MLHIKTFFQPQASLPVTDLISERNETHLLTEYQDPWVCKVQHDINIKRNGNSEK